jgi:acetyl esterase/lipase
MPSVQARLTDVVLRATRAKRTLGRRLDGAAPVRSAQPDRRLRAACVVTEALIDGHPVWTVAPAAPEAEGAPTVLFLHGGAYVSGFDALHWRFVRQLVERTGATVVAPEYPLAPQATADHVVAWTVARWQALPADDGPRVLMGDSAGGGLALAVAMALRDADQPLPDHLVLLAPWLDATMSAPDAAALDRGDRLLARDSLLRAGALYAGNLSPRDPRVSPLFGDLQGLPPTDVFAGGRDQLVADARRLAVLAAADAPDWALRVHETADVPHDYMIMDFLPEAQRVVDALTDLLATLAPPGRTKAPSP